MIKIISSILIPIALFVSYVTLISGLKGLYKNDNLNYSYLCVIIGVVDIIFLTILAVLTYRALFGY